MILMPAARYRATIVPISDGKTIRNSISVECPFLAEIHEFRYSIRIGLMKDNLVTKTLMLAGLEILPLPETPSLSELKNMDLAALHKQAQFLRDLPSERASDFFRMQNLRLAHFLVWLPPEDGTFHWLNLLNN